LKPEQWFTLWITILSIFGGCVAAVISVWIGASLALRSNRRSLRQERGLSATERCLAAVNKAFEEYRQIDFSMTASSEEAEVHMDPSIVERITSAYDNFVYSEVGHEAWLLEDRAITLSIAGCLQDSQRLHVDSFVITAPELKSRINLLSSRLWNVGELLRASLLNKPVNELTDKDRAVIAALLPGRHIKKEAR